jgi:hypothetical protein
MTPAGACAHPGKDLQTLLVLDQQIYMTDAFVRCGACNTHMLVELVDMQNHLQVFRVLEVDEDAVQATLRSLNKGSCDINRARNEVLAVSSTGRAVDKVLLAKNGQLTGFVPLAVQLPQGSWRELPCDGTIVQKVLAATR